MNGVENSKKKSQPQLVKLDRSFKLAEQWVNNMSESSAKENFVVVELEGRPARLGIGATVQRESKVVANDPIGRNLLAKLNANKRKIIDRAKELEPSAKDGNVGEESEEDDSESKTKAFAKKRSTNLTSPLMAKRKHV